MLFLAQFVWKANGGLVVGWSGCNVVNNFFFKLISYRFFSWNSTDIHDIRNWQKHISRLRFWTNFDLHATYVCGIRVCRLVQGARQMRPGFEASVRFEPLSCPLALQVNHAPLGIRTGMAYFRMMWQIGPDIAHWLLKGTASNQSTIIKKMYCDSKIAGGYNMHCAKIGYIISLV